MKARWLVPFALAACSPAPQIVQSTPAPAATVSTEPVALEVVAQPTSKAQKAVVMALARVSGVRGLRAKRPVEIRVLDRRGILERIRAHVEREIPQNAIVDEGEALGALELLPADYDYLAGSYALIQGRIGGFYEPADGTMYLVDDLDDAERTETLAHELVHALQDQSFSLATMLAYAPGAGDRTAAAHALVEGDATSAMIDLMTGKQFAVSEGTLRATMTKATASSEIGARTPAVLVADLVAPYVDGYAFVQALRRRGGWAAVDAALAHPPETTEQLLHLDKYDAREPALAVPAIPLGPLGAGFRTAYEDTIGEQGLRSSLEAWVDGERAARAAAGWGGDREIVARRDEGSKCTVAVAQHLRFDTDADAAGLDAILASKFGRTCRERPALGPMAWKRQGRDVVVAAGPYVREGKSVRSAATCAVTTAWLAAILATK